MRGGAEREVKLERVIEKRQKLKGTKRESGYIAREIERENERENRNK